MQAHEFYARTREIGNYVDTTEAKAAVNATLQTLAERLPAEEAKDLAAQLPGELKVPFSKSPESKSIKKMHAGAFFESVGERLHGDAHAGRRAAEAVTRVLSEAVTDGEIRHVWQMMPADLRPLFQQEI